MKYSTNFISATENYSTYTDFVPVPYLRKSFELDFAAEKAEMLVCGLGFYEFWLNGEHLTRGCLAPYISNPNDLLYYDRYDLTDKLKKGKNVIAFALGNGMQNNLGGAVWDFQLARFRSAPKLALCFECSGDGKKLCFEADESFKDHTSPTYFDDHRCGERYDARNEVEGWNLPEFDDSEWNNAISVEAPSGECREGNHTLIKKIRELKPVSISKGHISHYPNPRENLPKVKLPEEEYSNEGYIYDFGENISGIVRLKIKGRRGQKIVMTCGESLFDGGLDMFNIGEFQPVGMTQCQVYICKGEGEEIWEPMFCYHCFRYCFVTGIDEDKATEDLLTYVVMHAELHPVGGFTCSNELVNKLQDATVRSDLANIFYFPTDCPHREKNGWTGDGHLAIETALYNYDGITVYEKWLADHRDEQQPNGVLPDIIPTGGWGYGTANGLDWTSTIAIIPWNLYLFYGDTKPLEDCYENIKRYVDYVDRRSPGHLTSWGRGDWVPVRSQSSLELTSSVYFYVDATILARAAVLFGREADREHYAALAGKIRKAVNDKYLDRTAGIYASGTQTELSVPLMWGVVPEELTGKVAGNLARRVEEAGFHLDVGVLGAKAILNALSENGYADVACKVAMQDTYPSWGWWIVNGATTLLENWNLEATRDISDNHMMFGEIGGWFFKGPGGIKPDPEAPGFKHILLRPNFVGVDAFEASHDAPCGRIVSAWKRKGNTVTYRAEIPANSTATLYLPANVSGEKVRSLGAGSHTLTLKIAK